MTNEEIVYDAIQKAEKNGFKYNGPMCCIGCESIIFEHDFAKAFCKYIVKTNQINKLFDVTVKFVEKEIKPAMLLVIKEKFLIKLVLSTDRLKHIGRFL